jgi:hypothetical protein
VKVRIDVTQSDIDGGMHSSAGCPCARAGRRLPGLQGIRFGAYAWAFDMSFLPSWQLPSLVRDWIHDYDAGRPVKPFSFDLDIPDDLLAGAS